MKNQSMMPPENSAADTEVRCKAERKQSLWGALDLDPAVHRTICLVGAGGKTTAMYRLAAEAAKLGLRVIVTTTTRIRKPESAGGSGSFPTMPGGQIPHRVICLHEKARELRDICLPGQVLTVGQDAEPGKLKGLSLEETGMLREYCDVLLIEADGSKRLPFKVPEQWEPVILPETQAVIAVAGLSAVGCPMERICFRTERAAKVLGVSVQDLVTPRMLARSLSDPEGQRKGVGEIPYRILLNQADSERERNLARQTAEELLARGEDGCAAVSFRQEFFCRMIKEKR